MPSGKPKVAQCEEYDSDASAAKPGTRVKAQRRATTTGPPVSLDRHRGKHKSTNSDSGYSSHTTGTQESKASADAKAMPPPARPASAQTATRSNPVPLQRSSSQRNSQGAPTRSPTKAKPSATCNDPKCNVPNCTGAAQDTSRRNSTVQYPVQYPPQYVPSPGGQPQSPYQYTYQQLPQSSLTQTIPTLAQPRPRTGSISQQGRPASFHAGYAYPPSAASGPPPSTSAYQNQMLNWNAALQQQAIPNGGLYGTTPPNQLYPNYLQASPIRSSPIASNMPIGQSLQRAGSARSIDRNFNPVTRPQAQPIQSARLASVRHQSARVSKMPGSFPGQQSSGSDSYSDSDSASDYSSEEENERTRPRARDSRLMSSSSQRRPSINQRTVTDSAVYTRPPRDVLVRNPRSDHVLEDILSSDNMDSDRTTRAVAGRPRTIHTGSSKGSRRPSVSTTASSGRTRTTAPSSVADPTIVVEDSKGRRVSYLSQRDRESIMRQVQAQELEKQQRQRESAIEDYQNKVRGSRPPELTVDNIRKQQFRASGSHMSHSRKSSRSGSHVGGDGVKIDYGGTTLHVYGGTTIELQPGEDGAPAKMIIGSSSGKDSAYHSGSKSSSSRVGRSRGGSERGSRRRERSRREDEYEPAL